MLIVKVTQNPFLLLLLLRNEYYYHYLIIYKKSVKTVKNKKGFEKVLSKFHETTLQMFALLIIEN